MSSDTSPEQRAGALRAVDRGVRRLALAGLRARHPGASDAELIVRLFASVHGRELALRVYGWFPEEPAA